jgi:peptide deformylase
LKETGSQVYQEGCLSVPQVFEKVERSEKIKGKALDQDGNILILKQTDCYQCVFNMK